jgi:hypothetical protein
MVAGVRLYARLQEQAGLIAQKFGQAEKLALPEWYITYLTDSRQALELIAEGFQLTGQVWDKTNTLVTVLPQLDEQLQKAGQSSALSQDSWSRYTQYLQRHEFDAARQVAASMRAESTQYQGYFQQAYNDTGLDFLMDAIQFFGKEVELTNLMDQITAAVAANDQGRLDQLIGQLGGLDAEISRLAQRMQAWDTEMTRWMQVNIQPLLDRAKDKFAEAVRLGLVAANLFDARHHSIIIKEPKRLFPSLERPRPDRPGEGEEVVKRTNKVVVFTLRDTGPRRNEPNLERSSDDESLPNVGASPDRNPAGVPGRRLWASAHPDTSTATAHANQATGAGGTHGHAAARAHGYTGA